MGASIQHKHILIRAECKLSPKSHQEKLIETKLDYLIKDISMTEYLPPKAKFCTDYNNTGMTAVAGLATSHIALHFFDDAVDEIMTYNGLSMLSLDLYTCGDLSIHQVQTILKFVTEYQPQHVNAVVFDRAKALITPAHTFEFDIKDGVSYINFVENLKLC